MFENNMNNNGNFNQGIKPLFENNSDGTSLDNSTGFGPLNNTSYQSFQNEASSTFQGQGTYPYDFGNQNNIFGAGNDSLITNQNLMQQSETFSPNLTAADTQMDIPPELGDIKSLSDATVSSAPTMDVLDPMNVMPENLMQKQDPLDAYESGNLNLQSNTFGVDINNNSSFTPQNYNVPNSIAAYPQNSTNVNAYNPVSPLVNNTNSIEMNNYNNISVQNQIPVYENNNQSLYGANNISNLDSFNLGMNNNQGYNSIDNQNLSSINSMTGVENSVLNNSNTGLNNNPTEQQITNDFESQNNLTSQLPPLNDYGNNNADNLTRGDGVIPTNLVLSSDFEEEGNSEDGSSGLSFLNINNGVEPEVEEEITKEEFNGNEKQDRLKDTNLEDKDINLEDLGIDADYSEPDTLEIMDIDNDLEQSSLVVTNESLDEEDELKNQEPKALVSTNVDKIKALIEELKEAGADIELEEFDFESMYQLIVKLKK